MSSAVALLEIKKLRDPAKRVFDLIDKFEPAIGRAFLEMVRQIKSNFTLKELEELIIAGRLEDAFEAAAVHIERFSNVSTTTFTASADGAAGVISQQIEVVFDGTNFRAVELLRNNRFNLISQISDQQRETIRQTLLEGTRLGLNPREQARAFRDSIGLTANQEAAVRNYQRLLEEGDIAALGRKLRDARFDRTVERAIRDAKPLKADQIENMVGRYRERYIKFRAETIGRNEALSAVHEGSEEMYAQAIDSGKLDPADLEGRWHTARDARVRDTHSPMSGQIQPFGTPFISGAGVLLRYPGDRLAPAKEIIQCRCAKSVRFIKEG